MAGCADPDRANRGGGPDRATDPALASPRSRSSSRSRSSPRRGTQSAADAGPAQSRASPQWAIAAVVKIEVELAALRRDLDAATEAATSRWAATASRRQKDALNATRRAYLATELELKGRLRGVSGGGGGGGGCACTCALFGPCLADVSDFSDFSASCHAPPSMTTHPGVCVPHPAS